MFLGGSLPHSGLLIFYCNWTFIRVGWLNCTIFDWEYFPTTTSPLQYSTSVCGGGSKGDVRDARRPGGSNSFNFIHFLGNFGKIVCWQTPSPRELTPPHLGEISDPPLIWIVWQSNHFALRTVLMSQENAIQLWNSTIDAHNQSALQRFNACKQTGQQYYHLIYFSNCAQ